MDVSKDSCVLSEKDGTGYPCLPTCLSTCMSTCLLARNNEIPRPAFETSRFWIQQSRSLYASNTPKRSSLHGLGVPSSYLGPSSSSPPQAGVSGCPLYGVGAPTPPGVGASPYAALPENFGVGAVAAPGVGAL